MHTGRQTARHIQPGTYCQADMQSDTYNNQPTHTARQTYSLADRHADIYTAMHAYIQTDRHTDIQADIQTSIQQYTYMQPD